MYACMRAFLYIYYARTCVYESSPSPFFPASPHFSHQLQVSVTVRSTSSCGKSQAELTLSSSLTSALPSRPCPKTEHRLLGGGVCRMFSTSFGSAGSHPLLLLAPPLRLGGRLAGPRPTCLPRTMPEAGWVNRGSSHCPALLS